MKDFKRRDFLKLSGTTLLPALLPVATFAKPAFRPHGIPPSGNIVNFYLDGEMYDPGVYLEKLQALHARSPISRDRYGKGGAVEALEKKFESVTGKEKAMFMPTGTMANQLAIAVLSGEKAKVFVQETSHVFRDEADAAQTVFNKRLIPLAKGLPHFTAEELDAMVQYLNEEEVFKSGMGVVSVENPVRRCDGKMVPIEQIRKINDYCRKNQLRLHLDGARLYMASAWSGVSIKEYASYFDTVYISLYKYLGAAGGAMLCGEKKVIDKMEHLVKIHGGSMFGNWANAAMALDRLDGVEERLKSAIERSKELFTRLNQLKGIKVTALPEGTNIYLMQMDMGIDSRKLAGTLAKDYGIRMIPGDKQNTSRLTVNETLLYREPASIAGDFEAALKTSRT